jgi:hypothetical protein
MPSFASSEELAAHILNCPGVIGLCLKICWESEQQYMRAYLDRLLWGVRLRAWRMYH